VQDPSPEKGVALTDIDITGDLIQSIQFRRETLQISIVDCAFRSGRRISCPVWQDLEAGCTRRLPRETVVIVAQILGTALPDLLESVAVLSNAGFLLDPSNSQEPSSRIGVPHEDMLAIDRSEDVVACAWTENEILPGKVPSAVETNIQRGRLKRSIGEAVKEFRLRRHLAQIDLAQSMGFTSHYWVSGIETNLLAVTSRDFLATAGTILAFSLDELYRAAGGNFALYSLFFSNPLPVFPPNHHSRIRAVFVAPKPNSGSTRLDSTVPRMFKPYLRRPNSPGRLGS
jgi:transcriptional regulator with XRE-family HTH domain